MEVFNLIHKNINQSKPYVFKCTFILSRSIYRLYKQKASYLQKPILFAQIFLLIIFKIQIQNQPINFSYLFVRINQIKAYLKFNIKNNYHFNFNSHSTQNSHMEIQRANFSQMIDQNKNHSQITCNSSNSNSPGSDIRSSNQSICKAMSCQQTMISSPIIQQTPQKTYNNTNQSSYCSLDSLQKRSYSQKQAKNTQSLNSVINKSQKMDKQNYRKLSMQDESIAMVEQNKNELNSNSQYHQRNNIQCQQQGNNVLLQNKNIKIGSHLLNKENNSISQNYIFVERSQANKQQGLCTKQALKFNNQVKQNNNISVSIQTHQNTQINNHFQANNSTQINTKIIQTKTTKSLISSYLNARSQLYSWMRNLCFQLNMCLDVFILSMKYLDQYHITHQNPYNRKAFTLLAYGIVIVASKMANKKVLSCKIVASKINTTSQVLQQQQMRIIKMFVFQMYHHTVLKEFQIISERWQELMKKNGLMERYSLFSQNLQSFRRYYSLIKQLQLYAKNNIHFDRESTLMVFVKSLREQFIQNNQQHLLAELLTQVFMYQEDIKTEGDFMNIKNKILQKIQMDLNVLGNNVDNLNMEEQMIRKAYQRRNLKNLYSTYSVFLNSIFEMKL